MPVVIHSTRLVTAGRVFEDGWVRFDADRITASGTADGWRTMAAPGDVTVDARSVAGPGAVLTPGFVDIHGHGGAGAAYDDGGDAIRTARALHRSHGTTRAVISLVTADVDDMIGSVAVVADLTRTDPDILGSHLEGPFLDPGHHGAHEPSLLRPPAPAVVERLLDAGRSTVRQVTIAPELPGGIDAVRQIVASGAAAAIGHTDADSATAREAIEAGATILTHAFNAMPPIHHRAPGPLPVATSDARVTLELIADGVHVHDEAMRMLFDAARGRIALVTDAMAATGMTDGAYTLGRLAVEVSGGVARVRETGSIAGSTLTQDAALRRIVAAGVPLEAAVHALTSAPASAVGRGDDLGALASGYLADAVLLDAELAVRQVWTAGERT